MGMNHRKRYTYEFVINSYWVRKHKQLMFFSKHNTLKVMFMAWALYEHVKWFRVIAEQQVESLGKTMINLSISSYSVFLPMDGPMHANEIARELFLSWKYWTISTNVAWDTMFNPRPHTTPIDRKTANKWFRSLDKLCFIKCTSALRIFLIYLV